MWDGSPVVPHPFSHLCLPVRQSLFISESENLTSIATVNRHESKNQQQHSDSLEFHSSLPPFVLITSISEIKHHLFLFSEEIRKLGIQIFIDIFKCLFYNDFVS